MNGYGVFTWSNGDKYEGTFCRGKFRGEGLFTYGNNNNHNVKRNTVYCKLLKQQKCVLRHYFYFLK